MTSEVRHTSHDVEKLIYMCVSLATSCKRQSYCRLRSRHACT